MKNKWLVFGTLLGVAVGAGILYFGIKKFKEHNKETEHQKVLTKAAMRRLMK